MIGASKDLARKVLGPLVRSVGDGRSELPIERWQLERSPAGLALEGVPLHELAERFGSPLHVVRRAKLLENAAAFTAVPRGAAAGCEIFYSYKTNPVPGVLKLLHAAGVGAEVISPFELWLARRLGVPPERTIYNGPAKSVECLREAMFHGLEVLNLNHREEIALAAGVAQELGLRARVGLRVSVDQGWGLQFGVPIAGDEALEAYREALAQPSLDVVGLHAHRGATIRQPSELREFVRQLLGFCDTLAEKLDFQPEIVNFGGSLCTPTVDGLGQLDYRLNRAFFRDVPAPDPNAALSIDEYVTLVVSSVEDHFRTRGRPRPRIFLEPGRAMTGNVQLLLTKVMALKANGESTYAVLDAGLNHAEPVQSEYHQLFPVNRFGDADNRRYTLVGPICTPGDLLYPARNLPELAHGDTLAIMDSGAYFIPFSTTFSYPRPGVVLLDGGQVTSIRRAECFEDMVRNDGL